MKSILQTAMEVFFCFILMTYVDIRRLNVLVCTFLQSLCLHIVLYLMAVMSRCGQEHLALAKLIQQFC